MPTVYGYARASTGEQLDTLKIQQEVVEKEYLHRFKDKGYAWGGVYTDQGVSGGVCFANRPEGFKLNLAMERGDVVIISKLDRGFRNAGDFLNVLKDLARREVALVMLDMNLDTSTPVGRLMASILAVFAEFERDRMRERQAESIAQRRAEGRPTQGNPPYGLKITGPRGDKRFVTDTFNRNIGSHIVRWVDAGWTFEQVYFHMLREKIKTRRGKEWGLNPIRRAYKGEKKLRLQEAAKNGEAHSTSGENHEGKK
jgi:DNA invertase Pin-like site-specific DNA recombinase